MSEMMRIIVLRRSENDVFQLDVVTYRNYPLLGKMSLQKG